MFFGRRGLVGRWIGWHLLWLLVILELPACRRAPRVMPASEPGRVLLVPFDEASLRPELYASRSALLRALGTKDRTAMLAWIERLSRTVDVTHLLEAEGAVAQLAEMLMHGGLMRDGWQSFCGPYWWGAANYRVPEAVDSVRSAGMAPWAVIRPTAVVRAQPSASSSVVQTVSFELLYAQPDIPSSNADRFLGVQVGAQKGFVDRADVRALSSQAHVCWRPNDDNTTWKVYELSF